MPIVHALAKHAAPSLARLLPVDLVRSVGLYCDILQGRGSGTGWDIQGEALAAARAISRPARGTPVIVDAGANFGQWSSAVHAAMPSNGAQFVLIEPQVACQAALEALPIRNKTIVKAAIGSAQGDATIRGESPGFGAASIYDRRDTYFGDMNSHSETVPITTVDHLMDQLDLARIDLLKLDVEGAEWSALQGATKALEDDLIRAIAFEFGSANIYARTYFRDFWDLLTSYGFRVGRVVPGGDVVRVDRYSEELEHFRGVSNYVCTL